MAKHAFFTYGFNGFFNGNAERHLLAPFNISDFEDNTLDETYLKDCLYKMTNFSPKKDMNFICGISKGIVKIALANLLKDEALKGFGGYGVDNNGNFWADYIDCVAADYNKAVKSGSNINENCLHTVVMIDGKSKEMKVALVDEFGGLSSFKLQMSGRDTGAHSASALCYAMMAYYFYRYQQNNIPSPSAELVFATHLQDFIDGYISGELKREKNALRAAENDFYTIIQYPVEVTNLFGQILLLNPVDYHLPMFPLLTGQQIKKAKFEAGNFFGNSVILGAGKVSKAKTSLKIKAAAKTVGDIVKEGKYSLKLDLTEAQKKLIPQMDSFVVNEQILDICDSIVSSRDTQTPVRQVLMTGPTGSGKTTACQMICQILGLPYYNLPLSAGRDENFLYSSLIPKAKKITMEDYKEAVSKFPDSATIMFDPVLAYEMVTGITNKEATEEDVINAEDEIRVKLLNDLNGYEWVDSGLVKAYRYGGGCELTEMNAGKPGILKALNEALDDLNHISTPSGEIISRNPNCFIFATANIGKGYEGVHKLSADLIARFQQANEFNIPSDDELTERIIAKSGYNDRNIIKKMLEVMRAMQKVMVEAEGHCETVSPRLLYNWARKTARIGDPWKAGITTMVNMVSQNEEIREELIKSLNLQFVAPAE